MKDIGYAVILQTGSECIIKDACRARGYVSGASFHVFTIIL